MSFLREILDEYVIGWDEKRYDKWKEKDDRRWNARTMKPLLTRKEVLTTRERILLMVITHSRR